MNQSVSGCVVDEATNEPLTSPEVRLYRTGTPGETCAVLNKDGCFSFSDMSEGEYSLTFYDTKYVPQYERLTIVRGQIVPFMHISLRRGGFLSGRILDETQQPPAWCWFTLIRADESVGAPGYASELGDHEVSEDGTFCSPPLRPAQYFLRFAGVLRKAAVAVPIDAHLLTIQERVFDFLYPDAQQISDAKDFDVPLGQTISGLHLQIPRPVWHTVRGRVLGELPTESHRLSVMFSRTMGTNDVVGGGGGPKVEQNGTFEHQLQSGDYVVEVLEFPLTEPDGRTSVLRKFAATNIRVRGADLDGIEIHIPS